MTTYTHQTAPTQYVEARGIRFAYRRFGKAGGVPLVFNQHFTGTMDHWDPLVTDGLAATREIILFDNAGISSSSGDVPTNFASSVAASLCQWISYSPMAPCIPTKVVSTRSSAPSIRRPEHCHCNSASPTQTA